jgi:CMP/dCMP kinase
LCPEIGLPIIETTLTQEQGSQGPSRSEPKHGAAPAALIAIDGPVASGKTAVGLRLARDFGYRLVDTGMMYRAVTWLALENGLDFQDEEALVRLARSAQIELGQPTPEHIAEIKVNGIDVTGALRSPEIDRKVSTVSRFPGVREAMVQKQRALAAEGQLIMLGRDIGTVVLPDAPLKIYLDASAEERARRRYLELLENGAPRPEEEIRAELQARDDMDRNRHASPLKPADDAKVIRTDDLALDEVVERVRQLARA